MASTTIASAASAPGRSGAKPPSSPTAVAALRSCRIFFSVWTTQVLVEREIQLERRGAGRRQRDAEDGVGARLALVGRAVGRQHGAVEPRLIEHVPAGDDRPEKRGHVLAGLADAFAHVALLVTVAQLERFVLTGRRARRHGGAAHHAGLQGHLDFNRGIAAGIEDLARQNAFNHDRAHAALHSARVVTGASEIPRCRGGLDRGRHNWTSATHARNKP